MRGFEPIDSGVSVLRSRYVQGDRFREESRRSAEIALPEDLDDVNRQRQRER